MKKTQRNLVMALALTSVVAVAGCSKEEEKVPKFSKEEETAYVKTFAEKVLKPETPSVILAEVEGNVQKVSKQEASNMVDGLLYSLHQKSPEMNGKIQGLQQGIRKLEEKKIDYNDPKQLDKVKDETLKAFLKETHKMKYVIQNVSGDYLARPDIAFVLSNYGKYMNEDLKTMTKFSLEENENPFFNKEANSFDMNVVVERIMKIEKNMKKFPESFYQAGMLNSKNYYYQIYFGTNNSFLVDEKKVVLPVILEHYKETAKEHKDTQLGKDAQVVLDKLAKSKNVVTDDVYVFLLELTGTQPEEVTAEKELTEKKATKKANEAIQQAIEENKGSTDKKESATDKKKDTVNAEKKQDKPEDKKKDKEE